MSANTDPDEEVEQEYRVVSGTHRTADGDVLEPGDTFTPTRHEVERFGFKLEPVGEAEGAVEPSDTTEPTSSATEQGDEQAEDDVADTDTAPELVPPESERDTLVELAKALPSDAVNGNSSSGDIRAELTTLEEGDLRELYDAAGIDAPDTDE